MNLKKDFQHSISDNIPALNCVEEGKLVGGFSVLTSQESAEPWLNILNCSPNCKGFNIICATTEDTTEDTTQDPGQDPLIANSLLM